MASVYSTWLIYAAGIEFLLASMILYSRGIPLFFYRRREDKRPLIEGKAGLAYMLAMVAAASSGCSTSPQPKFEHCACVMPTILRKLSLA